MEIKLPYTESSKGKACTSITCIGLVCECGWLRHAFSWWMPIELELPARSGGLQAHKGCDAFKGELVYRPDGYSWLMIHDFFHTYSIIMTVRGMTLNSELRPPR